MAASAEEAEKGYKQFHGVSKEWAWKFRILQANALLWQGLADRTLSVLAAEPSPPSTGDLAVQRIRLEGSAYMALNDFSKAEQKFSEAERLCSISDSESCPTVAFERGGLETARGHFAQAQLLFEQTLLLARERGNRLLEASALLSLSQSAINQEHFDEALDWSQQSHMLSKSLGSDDLAQNALGNLGWAYYRLGEPEQAEELFIEAENRAVHLGDFTDQVKWLTTVGYVYLDAHEFEKAEHSYQQALVLAKHTTQQDVTDALMSLALVCERTGKLDKAQDYANRAINLAPKDGDRLNVLYPMLVKGHVAARQHDTQQAEKIYREIEQDPKSHVFLKWEAEHSLAQLYEDEKKPDAAEREYRAALSTFEGARAALHEGTSLPFPANAAGIYDDYIRFLVGRGKTDEALQVAEYQRGRALAEGLGILRKGSTFKPEALNAQAIARKAGGTILFYWLGEKQSYLWVITARKIAIFPLPPKSEIEPMAQRYRKALSEQQEFLPRTTDDGQALYRMLVEPADLMGGVGGGNRVRRVGEIPSAAKAASMVTANGTAEAVPLPKPFHRTSSGNIGSGNLIKTKTQTNVKKDTETNAPSPKVFIIPDGSLNTLNFETLLVSGSAPHYWIEDVTIADSSSLRLLAAAHAVNRRGGRLLVMGNAVAPNADYPELRNAPVEMESIEKHFPIAQQQVFAREHATPSAYLSAKPEQFSYIHFVAHGTASRMSPLDSAIVLSKAGAEDDSFKLYARDIIHHPLKAQLVTISTCYGAGARAYSGEGLVGLSWAFLRAGAHNVIGALWEVSDASTPQLMDELYRGLEQGMTPDAALRSAKLTLLRSGAAYRKPFYWAPFQLYTGS